MNSVKKYHEMKQDIVDKESLYLCSEPAIKLLKEWHL